MVEEVFTEHLFEGEEENIELDTLLNITRLGCRGELSNDFKIELVYYIEKEIKAFELTP